MTASSGLFLSFEGTEGSGKTTQITRLESWLGSKGRSVLIVREPGGAELSERIRSLLLDRSGPPINGWAELCLYTAARAQLVAERILPELEQGSVVLADRYTDASVAYQGGGRGLGARRVETLNRWVTGGLRPELTFLYDLDPKIGLERIGRSRSGPLDRLESESLVFHRRVRRAYLKLAGREPARFRVPDATLDPDELEQQVRSEIEPLL